VGSSKLIIRTAVPEVSRRPARADARAELFAQRAASCAPWASRASQKEHFRLISAYVGSVRGLLISPPMLRVAALSLVLALAAGPATGLLCRSLCAPEAAAASGCHHDSPAGTTLLAGTAACDEPGMLPEGVLRDDLRRGAAVPDALPAVSMHGLPPAPDADRLIFAPAPQRSLSGHPRTAVLRI
jgi:hypothetical protein